jgi:predicted nucleotidyltransferase
MELNDQPRPIWAVTPTKVAAAVQQLVETARPRQLFLFGSNVTGTGNSDSDLDVLVVTDDSVQNLRQESVRLRHALRGILMPMDILVVNESFFNAHRDTPGLIYREVLATGRLVYDAAQ